MSEHDWADEAAVVIINEVLDLRTKEARETIARQLRAIRKRGEEIGVERQSMRQNAEREERLR